MLLIVIAVALSVRTWEVVAFGIPIVLIQFATAPLAAHMVGRAAYRNRHDRRREPLHRRAAAPVPSSPVDGRQERPER